MRILVFGINYAPEPTGTGKYTAEMASWLAARGHEVEVVTAPPHYPSWRASAGWDRPPFATEDRAGVRVHRAPLRLPRRGSPSSLDRILLETSFHAASLRWWLPKVVRTRPDVIVAVTPPLQMVIAPLAFGALRRVPVVVHVQDLQVDAALRLGMVPDNRATRALYRVEGRLLRAAARVSTISVSMRERVIAKGVDPERTLMLPNWASIPPTPDRPRDNTVRRELGIRSDERLVLYSGNMGEKQGLEVVLAAAAALRDQPDLRFVVVGEGGARKRLEAQARSRQLDNVSFHDLLPWERVPELLAASDVNLVVQKAEAADLVMPSKLTNIMAVGRAAIGTAAPGTELHSVLTDHGVGIATPPGDAEALADAIRALRHDALRGAYEEAAYRYARKHLAQDRILERFEKDLNELVREGRGPRTSDSTDRDARS